MDDTRFTYSVLGFVPVSTEINVNSFRLVPSKNVSAQHEKTFHPIFHIMTRTVRAFSQYLFVYEMIYTNQAQYLFLYGMIFTNQAQYLFVYRMSYTNQAQYLFVYRMINTYQAQYLFVYGMIYTNQAQCFFVYRINYTNQVGDHGHQEYDRLSSQLSGTQST
jgi:hypothetical protein